jgi:hypothetical protein
LWEYTLACSLTANVALLKEVTVEKSMGTY